MRIQTIFAALALTTGMLAAEPDARAKEDPAPPSEAIKALSTNALGVALTVDPRYDAKEVAAELAKLLGTDAKNLKVKDYAITVQGGNAGTIGKLLAKLDDRVAPFEDDVDALLSTLRSSAGDDGDSGSSIRARKKVDFSDVIGDRAELGRGRVVKVERGEFPIVLISLKVVRAPKGVKLRRGQRIKLIPRVRSKNGLVDPTDKPSKLNVGAYYVRPGDNLRFRLEAEKPEPKRSNNIFVGAAVERVK